MGSHSNNRLLAERPLPRDGREREARTRAARSVTVNLAESPLGWLKARGLVSERQFDAGERLRADWERAQIAPSVTMKWDAPPAQASRTSCGGWCAPGKACAMPKPRSAGRLGPESWC